MESHQPDINYLSRHPSDLNAITDSDAVFPDEKEISHDRKDDTLEGNCYAGGDQSGKSYYRAKPTSESKCDDDGYQEPQYKFPQQQKLVPATRFVDITVHSTAPQLRRRDYNPDDQREEREANKQAFELGHASAAQSVFPVSKVFLVEIKQDPLLGQGSDGRRDLLELHCERIELLLLLSKLGLICR